MADISTTVAELRGLLASAQDGDSHAAEMVLERLPAILDALEHAERAAELLRLVNSGQANGKDLAAWAASDKERGR